MKSGSASPRTKSVAMSPRGAKLLESVSGVTRRAVELRSALAHNLRRARATYNDLVRIVDQILIRSAFQVAQPCAIVSVDDVVDVKQAAKALRVSEALIAGQKEALQSSLNGAALEVSLGLLVRTARTQWDGGTRAVAFYLSDAAGKTLHHVVGMPVAYAEAVNGFKIGPESLACGLAVHTGQPVITPDVKKERLWKQWRWLAEKFDYRGCWSFPIMTSTGRFVGTMALYFREPRDPVPRDLALAGVLTHAASVIMSRHKEAVERAHAEEGLRRGRAEFEQLSVQLQALTENPGQDALYRLSTLLIDGKDPGALHENALDIAMVLMHADFAAIQNLVNPEAAEAAELQLLGWRNFHPDSATFWQRVTWNSRTSCSAVLRDKSRFAISDVEGCDLLAGTGDLQEYRRSGIRATQSTPLISRSGQLLGVISTFWRKPHEATAAELRTFDVLARQVADFLERSRAEETLRQRSAKLEQRSEQLRALAREVMIAEQRERQRLAKILHDHVQQLLVGARLRVSSLPAQGEHVGGEVAKIEELLRECLETCRTLTADLSPAILHEQGLMGGLTWLVRRTSQHYGLEVTLVEKETAREPIGDTDALLFESVRELLLNIVKHAAVKAARVEVRVNQDQTLRVIVSDKGVGFDPARLRAPGEQGAGIGLFSIRERLNRIGGGMDVEAAPGKGCRVTLSVPAAKLTALLSPPAADASDSASQSVSKPQARASVRVLIADDHTVMRDGLFLLLSRQHDIQVVGEAADGQEAVKLARQLRPDVILMDVSIPKVDGIEATRIIHRELPKIRIIGLSMFEDGERKKKMANAGAVKYVSKSRASDDLVEAIRACAAVQQASGESS